MYTKQDIMALVDTEDVRFIRLQFADITGTVKNVAITVSQLEEALDNKIVFDGTAIEGFTGIAEEDMFLVPDLDTFAIFPWRPHQGKVARFICDVYTQDGKPFECDSRNVLKRVIAEAKSMGYEFKVGPECEFFLFNTDDEGRPTTTPNDDGGYFDVAPIDNGENCRREIVMTMEEMGYEALASHHEKAYGQHEVDFQYSDALVTADWLITFKMLVKTVAKRNGLHATFMPKPLSGMEGSGMHLNMMLEKDGKHVFTDELNSETKSFIAGIMHYIPEICCLTNPTVNSYKRLVCGYDAPSRIAWSRENKNLLIRVPRTNSSVVELCSPDATANPYLALAACLAAGLEGIKNAMELPDSIDVSLNSLSKEEVEKMGIEEMPINLFYALRNAKKSEFVKNLLGDKLFKVYIKTKEIEYDEYREEVSKWEIDKYLIKY